MHVLMRMACGLLAPGLLSLATSVVAQAPLPQPNVTLHGAGGVNAMARQADGRILVGGAHVLAGKDGSTGFLATGGLHRLNADGSVDTSFRPAPNGTVTRIAVTATHAFVAGSFEAIGGLERVRVAKISLSSGLADAAWNPAPNASVEALAVDANGYVYVAGQFSSIGGQTGRKLVKLDGATGQALAGWNPVLPDTLAAFTGLAASGTDLYVAGRVASDVSGYTGRLYRIGQASGTVDAGFAAPTTAINGVQAIAVDGSGNVYVGGPGGTTATAPFVPLATLTKLLAANGAVDTGWPVISDAATALAVDNTVIYVGTTDAALMPDLGSGPQRVVKRNLSDGTVSAGWSWTSGLAAGYVTALVPSPEGVVMGGYFRETGALYTPGLARLDAATGALQPAWMGGAYQVGSGQVVVPLADGKMLIGGSFDLVDLQLKAGLARLNADSTLDSGFNADANGNVWQVLVQGNALFVGGMFTRIGGQPIRGIARLDATTGAADAGWTPNPDGSVRRLVADGTDLYIGGSFSNVGGFSRPRIARLTAATGATVTAFAPPLSVANTNCPGTFGLAVSGGWVYSGCPRNPGTGFIRAERFSPANGAADPTWNPNPTGGPVRAIVANGGSIYLVGDFTTVGGQAKYRIAKVSETTGALDAAWGNAPQESTSVNYVASFVGDHVYVGSGIGQDPFRPSLFRLSAATGFVDSSWSPSLYGGQRQFGVQSIVGNADGSAIFVAGNFDRISSISRRGFAVLATSAGPALPKVASGASHSLAVNSAGQVVAWGSDSYGQLGLGRAVVRSTPVQVPGVPAITQAALSRHVLAVDSSSRVWAWGDNSCGQLGPRESVDASKPSRVIGATGVSMVAAGPCFSVALATNGTVYGWGLVPGYGTDTGLRVLPGLSAIVEIAAGTDHVLGRRSDGAVFAFGSNAKGQLGLGANTAPQPATVVAPAGSGIVAISAGRDTSAVLLASGQVLAWGVVDGFPVTTPAALPAAGGTVSRIYVADSSTGMVFAVHSDGTVVRYSGGVWIADYAGFANVDRVASDGQVRFGVAAGGQLSASGSNTAGLLGQGNTSELPGVLPVPGFTSTAFVHTANSAAIAAKGDGSLWFWGQDPAGLAGDGTQIGSSVPAAVSIPGTVQSVATGEDFSVALDTLGRFWGWGLNSHSQFGAGDAASSTPRHLFNSGDVSAIAAGRRFMAALGDGAVYAIGDSGLSTAGPEVPAVVAGMAAIVELAAGQRSVLGLAEDGRVYAAGDNDKGQLGNGTTASSIAATPVQGITGRVVRISAGARRAGAITNDGKVWMWGEGPLGNGGNADSATAVQVSGITDAIELSVGSDLVLVLRRDGSVIAWGDLGLADASGRDPRMPYPVTLPGPVGRAVAAGASNRLGFIVNEKGVAWGFGRYGSVASTSAAIGDGAYVPRDRPVVLKAAGGTGSLDSNDWYLDLDPATAQTVAAESTPKAQAVASVSGSETALAVEATIKYKAADLGKPVNNYVFGLVPTGFFTVVKKAPGVSSPAKLASKAAKADGFVLAQLTPSGWTDVSGQLIAYSQGTANALGGATNILNGVDTTLIAGARFCVGYGEDSGSMLTFQALSEVLLLEGAATNVSGVPCVLTGIYVDGSPSSRVGTAVAFSASVVGLSPTGSVQFTDGGGKLLGPVALAMSNEAVGTAGIATSALALGVHSIGAAYGGDAQNAAVSAEIPVRHEVLNAPPGGTSTTLAGPASSELGSQVVFSAMVAGDAPTGSVQFKDGTANLGGAVALVGGMATLRTDALALGLRSVTAAYSGDGKNAASNSNAVAHTVLNSIGTTVTLTSSAETSTAGGAVTFTATVTGNNPTGNVIFRDGAAALATVGLVNGAASLTLNNFDAGQHLISAEYAGDANNPAVTSAPLYQQVALSTSGRLANISTRGRVQTGNDVMIGGFVVSGSAPKKVLITARGPSLAAFGVTGAMADPKLELFSGQTMIAANDNWQSNANVPEIQATGIAPTNPFEAALMVTLNPGPYTAIVSGINGGMGVGIVEVFEQDRPDIPLVNISTRGQVQTGDNVMIGGFIIQGSTPQKVLITARGPSLAPFGIANPLANPVLQLFSGQTVIASNDDWQTNANVTEIAATGVAPTNPLESAILITLNPGAYTAIVSGVGGGTGVGIVEVFAR